MDERKQHLERTEIKSASIEKLWRNSEKNKDKDIALNDFITSSSRHDKKRKGNAKWDGGLEYKIENKRNKKGRRNYEDIFLRGDQDDDLSIFSSSSDEANNFGGEKRDDDSSESNEKNEIKFRINDEGEEEEDHEDSEDDEFKNIEKRARKLKNLGVGKLVPKREFNEALKLTKEVERLKESIMKDPNVRFILYVNSLLQKETRLFKPVSNGKLGFDEEDEDDIVDKKKKYKEAIIEKKNDLKMIKKELESGNFMKESFNFIHQPIIIHKMDLDGKVISALVELLTNLNIHIKSVSSSFLKNDAQLYDMIIKDQVLLVLFGRLVWMQVTKDENSEGQMHFRGGLELKKQITQESFKLIYLILEKSGSKCLMRRNIGANMRMRPGRMVGN